MDSSVLLAETGGKIKEQETRVQQASVEAALETSREAGAHHPGCGGDVTTLFSPLAVAIRKGQQQDPQALRCSDVQDGEPSNMLGSFHAAAQSDCGNTSRLERARCYQPSKGDRQTTPPNETRWTGDRRLFTGVVYGDGSAFEVETWTCAWQFGVRWRTRHWTARHRVWNAAVPHSRCRWGRALRAVCSCSCALRVPAQCVTDSSFVEQGVNQRGRKATVACACSWADLWRDVWCEIDAWRGLLKAHTTQAVLAGEIPADDRAGNDLADAACKLVVLLGRHTQGSLDCARWFCETAFRH